jgi:lipoprotein-anchoring transpeptidase ErfK/SrfK
MGFFDLVLPACPKITEFSYDLRVRFSRLIAVALPAALALCGCTSTGTPTERGTAPAPRASTAPPSASPTPIATFPAYSATAVVSTVQVHASADGPVTTKLTNPLPSGAPLTFLVESPTRPTGEWLKVLLPIRPNGSTGWIKASDAKIAGLPYRIDISLAAHRLDLFEGATLRTSYPIGVGHATTPTPGGTFYLKELLQPPDPHGAYGPYAYGLSGFSTTLDSFKGGDAVIGIHGTDDPSSVGKDVSHGCIRMRNDDITELAQLLPLGTPVRILA